MQPGVRLVGIALVFAAAPLMGQERAITGTVTDSLSRAPIAGAVLSVRGTSISAVARDNGQFTL